MSIDQQVMLGNVADLSRTVLEPVSDAEALTAVSALYELEQQRAADVALMTGRLTPSPETATSEERLKARRDERLRHNPVPTPTNEQPTLDELMAKAAIVEVRKRVERDHDTVVRDRAARRVGRMAVDVSIEQARWEIDNGLQFLPALQAIEVARGDEREAMEIEFTTWRAARRAFARNDGQPLSPKELAASMDLPEGTASPVISEMVSAGVLVRDVANNRLSPTAMIAPGRLRRFLGRRAAALQRPR